MRRPQGSLAKHSPYRLIRPTGATLSRLLAEQARELPTFSDSEQRRYRHMTASLELGKGPLVFQAAREHLETWEVHRAAGFRVDATESRAVLGSTVVLSFRFVAIHVLVACRVTRVIDDNLRAGFTYETLPVHAERGQQSFLVTRDASDVVSFQVDSRSVPHDFVTRAAAPVARAAQKRAARRYLSAMRRLVDGDAQRGVRPAAL